VPMFSKEPLRDLLAGSTPSPCCPLLFWRSAAHVFPEAGPSSSPPAELACGWGQVQVASEKGTGPMKCPNCQTRELVTIEMVVSGEEVALNSCSPCDLRWWQSDGGMLSLRGVLDLAAVGS
jgi:hypothetical protein